MNGWYRSKKRTVEDAGEALCVQRLSKIGLFQRGPCALKSLRLAAAPGNADVLIGVWFYRCGEDGGPCIQLEEDMPLPPERVREIEDDQIIELETTPCNYGGERFWFLCPMEVNGSVCGKRAGKLYLPPGEKLFGCRHCCDLTYESSQKHDARVDALIKDEVALDQIAQNAKSQKTRDLLLAMRAYKKMIGKDLIYLRGLRNKKV